MLDVWAAYFYWGRPWYIEKLRLDLFEKPSDSNEYNSDYIRLSTDGKRKRIYFW